MASKKEKDFNAMLHDKTKIAEVKEITDPGSVAKYGGTKMLIATPEMYDVLIRTIPEGSIATMPKIREKLAQDAGADFTCPLTAGIFTNIVAWASWQRGVDETPYWRVLKAGGELNPKYPGGMEAQKVRLEQEGHTVAEKGRKNIVFYVEDYEAKEWQL